MRDLHPKFIEHWKKLGWRISAKTMTSYTYEYGREKEDTRFCTYWLANETTLSGLYIAVLASDGEMRYRLGIEPTLTNEAEAIRLLNMKSFW